jgi:hypothetical protein
MPKIPIFEGLSMENVGIHILGEPLWLSGIVVKMRK